MSNFIDIKMEYDEKKGYYDILSDEKGDLMQDQSFDTSIILALLTDARADKTEVPLVQNQRGTIVDLFTEGRKRNGSKLWLLNQSRATLTAKNRAKDYARNALQFLVEKGYCKDVFVSSKLTRDGIILNITIQRLTGVFDDYRYNAWNNNLYKV